MTGMGSQLKGPPRSVADLADQALEGWDHLLSAESLAAMREIMETLYTSHPVMKAFAKEALEESRLAPEASEDRNIKGFAAWLEQEKKLGGT